MDIPFLCHVFLILFGGFFAIQMTFNSHKIRCNASHEFPRSCCCFKTRRISNEWSGFNADCHVFEIGGFTATGELLGAMGLFTAFAFIYNMGLFLKVFPTFDGADHEVKNAIRPLIPLIVIIIYFGTS